MLDCEYLIIGGGQTGLTVASDLAEKGSKIILVDQNKIGGSYIFTHEIPKALLREHATNFSKSLGIFKNHPTTFQVLLGYRQKIGKQIAKAVYAKHKDWEKYFAKHKNVQIITGTAEFLSKSLAEVNSTTERHLINFKNCIIATGQDQLVKPTITGLENVDFLYKDNCFLFEYAIPSQIGLVGLTEETLEVAGIYADLGIKVDIVDKRPDLASAFPEIDKSIINFYFKRLFAKQVDLHFGFEVKEVKNNKKGEVVLKSTTGQTQSFAQVYIPLRESFSGKGLAISKVGIKSTKTGIITDAFGKTTQSHIYALGECSNKSNRNTKQFMIQEYLQLQEKKLSLTKIILQKPTSLDVDFFYVLGQDSIFSIGLGQEKATDLYGNSVKRLLILSPEGEGFAKIIYRDSTGKVLGVSLAGDICDQVKVYLLDAFVRGKNYKEIATQIKIYLNIV